MKLFLVRNGETVYNREGRLQGDLDVPLSPLGRQQAAAVADRLRRERDERGESFVALYSSEQASARETAQIISTWMGDLAPVTLPGLREMSLGRWQSRTPDQIRASEGTRESTFDLWRKDPLRAAPPDGESLQQVEQRTFESLACLTLSHGSGEGAVIVISHGGPIGFILGRFMKVGRLEALRIRQDNGALNLIHLTGGNGEVLACNDTSHLEHVVPLQPAASRRAPDSEEED
jgi:broad specificity phosphatase PhoE